MTLDEDRNSKGLYFMQNPPSRSEEFPPSKLYLEQIDARLVMKFLAHFFDGDVRLIMISNSYDF